MGRCQHRSAVCFANFSHSKHNSNRNNANLVSMEIYIHINSATVLNNSPRSR